METRSLAAWATVITLSLGWVQAKPVLASDVVQYHPGSPFRLDPNPGNNTHDFGTIHIESDNSSGWTLQVQSSNEGTLSHSSAQASIPYILQIDGNTVNNLSSGHSVTVQSASRLTCSPPDGCDYQVEGFISSNDIDGKPSGSYSDTLIFTLVSP